MERCRGDHFVRVAELVCFREAPPKESQKPGAVGGGEGGAGERLALVAALLPSAGP